MLMFVAFSETIGCKTKIYSRQMGRMFVFFSVAHIKWGFKAVAFDQQLYVICFGFACVAPVSYTHLSTTGAGYQSI